MNPPLLLDLLPLGLTLTADDIIVAVCFDGEIRISADVMGAVGQDPTLLGLVQIGATATGRVFSSVDFEGEVFTHPTTTGSPVQVGVTGSVLGSAILAGPAVEVGLSGALLAQAALSGPAVGVGLSGPVSGAASVSGPVLGPC